MKITSCVDTGMNYYDTDSNCFGIDNIFWRAGVFPNSLNSHRFCNNENADAPVAGIHAAKFDCAGSDDIGCIPSTNRGLANYDRDSFAGHSLKRRKCSLKKRLPPKPGRAVSNNS
jgi:hypothetical protein